ncbi:MAG: SBBP repeat-containing protein [Saprospiraceae bacterium]|nr:SBBP repeat-containing protein [Saprospiraceae bacterium]
MKNLISTTFVLFIWLAVRSQPYLQWTSTYNGPLANDQGNSVAIDNQCNTYTIGSSEATNGFSDYLIIKYNTKGDTVWSRRYNGSGNGDDFATALKVDKAGNVYVTGYSKSAVGGFDIVTIKYNTNGVMQGGPLIFNGTLNKDDKPHNLDIDQVGNIYIVGSTFHSSSNKTDGIVIKYHSNLSNTPLWSNYYQSNSPYVNNYCNLITKKNNGNILVTDNGGVYGNEVYFRIYELNTSFGHLINQYNTIGYSTYMPGVAISVMVDFSDAVFVLSSAPTSSKYTRLSKFTNIYDKWEPKVITWDAWADRHFTLGNGEISGVSAVIDSRLGIIYAAAEVRGSDNYLLTMAWNSTQLDTFWDVRRYDFTSNASEYPISMALSNDMDEPGIVISGNNSLGNIFLIKYDTSGYLIWNETYDCGNLGLDFTRAMCLDQYDNIYLTGYSNCYGNDKDIQTIKYSTHSPEATITSKGPNKLCKGTSLILSVNTCSGCTYHWNTNDSSSSIVVYPSVSTSYKVTVTDGHCSFNVSKPFDVTIITVPNRPDSIVGDSIVCAGSQNNSYKILPVKDATKYFWQIAGAGWSGNGSITDTYLANAGNWPGQLKVSAINECGESDQEMFNIEVKFVPGKPSPISGNIKVCPRTMNTYAVFPVQNAKKYRWETIPANSGWISDNSTNNSVNLTAGSTSITLKVFAVNDCGESEVQDLGIAIVPFPETPQLITGNDTVCANSLNTYEILALPNADKYRWRESTMSWSEMPPSQSTVATFKASNLSTSIYVRGINQCGEGSEQFMNVFVSNVDNSVNKVGNTLTANANSATYRWLDCNDGKKAISDATDKTFTPTQNGSYCVEITQNNCTDTSVCKDVVIIYVKDIVGIGDFAVFPNPVGDELNIGGTSNGVNMCSVKIYDLMGRNIYYGKNLVENGRFNLKISLESVNNGIYLGEVITKTSRNLFRIYKL